LVALRELTLHLAAHEVDLRQSFYDKTRALQIPQISETRPNGTAESQPKERILIPITAVLRPQCSFVEDTAKPITSMPIAPRSSFMRLGNYRNWRLRSDKWWRSTFASPGALLTPTQVLSRSDIAKTVVEFARRNQVTQIFAAQTQAGFRERLRGRNYAENIVRLIQDLQLTDVADRSRRPSS
jgi:hypothetical protein